VCASQVDRWVVKKKKNEYLLFLKFFLFFANGRARRRQIRLWFDGHKPIIPNNNNIETFPPEHVSIVRSFREPHSFREFFTYRLRSAFNHPRPCINSTRSLLFLAFHFLRGTPYNNVTVNSLEIIIKIVFYKIIDIKCIRIARQISKLYQITYVFL